MLIWTGDKQPVKDTLLAYGLMLVVVLGVFMGIWFRGDLGQ